MELRLLADELHKSITGEFDNLTGQQLHWQARWDTLNDTTEGGKFGPRVEVNDHHSRNVTWNLNQVGWTCKSTLVD